MNWTPEDYGRHSISQVSLFLLVMYVCMCACLSKLECVNTFNQFIRAIPTETADTATSNFRCPVRQSLPFYRYFTPFRCYSTLGVRVRLLFLPDFGHCQEQLRLES